MSITIKTFLVMISLVMSPLTFVQAKESNKKFDESQVKSTLDNYANIALASYKDSLEQAEILLTAIESLINSPSTATLEKAKFAWVSARQPYQQTEVFRFGNSIVDDWEGRVNAWPLDEGLIDYVDSSYGVAAKDNPLRNANIIANTSLKISDKRLNTEEISASFLSEKLHEAEGLEANVAIGYHAIEFLLWGQDLNGVNPGAGQRSFSDFDTENCSNGHCDRRNDYLLAVSELLVEDLKWMVNQWRQDGAAREQLMVDPIDGLTAIIKGVGSLSYGELAGERIQLGLLLHDPEEEHDCFSDNTHYSHFYNIKGIENVYLGRYKNQQNKEIRGSSLSAIVAKIDPDLDALLRQQLTNSLLKAQEIVNSAVIKGVYYDQLLAENNLKGNLLLSDLVDALLAQTKSIESAATVLGLTNIELEGSDSLDFTEAVFK